MRVEMLERRGGSTGASPRTNVAVTAFAPSMVTLQVPAPEQPPPDHPVKVEPFAAAAVKTMTELIEKLFEHVLPQLIPEGEEVMVPTPGPALVTVRVGVGFGMNAAVTVLAASIVTLQSYRPEHAPDQPAKIEPGAGVALRTTSEPVTKPAEQVVPQSMPAGSELTDPAPEPDFEIVSAAVVVGSAMKSTGAGLGTSV